MTSSPRRRRITQIGTVTGVVDGSVIIIRENTGRFQEIRLLGVTTPEIIRPGVDCYGEEARDALRAEILGTQVSIEREGSYQRDSYRRLVRYVRLGSQDVNAWLIWNGYAQADANHDHERLNEYQSLEKQAQEAKRGLWSTKCEYNDQLEEVEVL